MHKIMFTTVTVLLFTTALSGCVEDNDVTKVGFLQKLIDDASEGDIINIPSGTYYENIVIDKSISLVGKSKSNTIINGNNNGSVVNITADEVTLTGFTIQNSEMVYTKAGIYVSSSYNKIYDNIIADHNYNGIYLKKSSNNDISNNIFSNNTRGIYIVDGSNNNFVFGNSVQDNNEGIHLERSSDNKIKNNHLLSNNNYGIYAVSSSNDNIIFDNTVTGNDCGIHIQHSNINTVTKNTINNNNKGLLYCCNSKNNDVYNNSFIQNREYNAEDIKNEDIKKNQWDNGIIGNYWDDYIGIDENGDGIGDIPYNVPGGDTLDHYPLMNPFQ